MHIWMHHQWIHVYVLHQYVCVWERTVILGYNAVIRHTLHHWFISAVVMLATRLCRSVSVIILHTYLNTHQAVLPPLLPLVWCVLTSLSLLGGSWTLAGIWQCEHTNWRHLCPPAVSIPTASLCPVKADNDIINLLYIHVSVFISIHTSLNHWW